jgi:hypothetical protein
MVELGLQSGAFQAQPRGCAIGSTELAVTLPQSAKNAFPFFIETDIAVIARI